MINDLTNIVHSYRFHYISYPRLRLDFLPVNSTDLTKRASALCSNVQATEGKRACVSERDGKIETVKLNVLFNHIHPWYSAPIEAVLCLKLYYTVCICNLHPRTRTAYSLILTIKRQDKREGCLLSPPHRRVFRVSRVRAEESHVSENRLRAASENTTHLSMPQTWYRLAVELKTTGEEHDKSKFPTKLNSLLVNNVKLSQHRILFYRVIKICILNSNFSQAK